jgi:serine/threonine protein kinase
MQLPGSEHNLPKSQDNSDAAEGLPRPFERFTLLRRVARGGMGEVYLAASGGIEGAERPVIVKLIRRDHETDASFLARFLDEARIQSQLQHPGVAQIIEAANDGAGKPYVVVEYIEGRNLADVRSRTGQLGVRVAWPEALAVACALGSALCHVHERTDAAGKPLEIVHRDLSPQNVMVSYDGDVKLIDFGTARGENRRCHTISGIVFAKPGYVAPEVANNQPGGVPADLYAFGVMLWELIAGRRFLVGEASVHLAAVGAGRRVPSPIAQATGAPLELDAVIAKLTATNIEDRYASARDAVHELARLLQRAPSQADGDRSVRGRIAHLMRRLYPSEPTRSRGEFARLVAEARALPPPKQILPASPEPPAAEPVDESLLPGTRYRLEGELGRGASGVVYKCVHLDLGRPVALKVLHETGDALSLEGFRAEARAIANLDHPHLVRLYEFGLTSDGRAFYAMELLEGETLASKLSREGALPWQDAIELLLQASGAADAAHRAGVVHRDIKPENLVLSRDGDLKLLDFGVAKAESEIERESADEALVLVGTPEYMAPEQARGGEADARSDVYALGAVLYELLTGRRPYQAESTVLLLEQKSTRDPESFAVAAPDRRFAPALEGVVLRALARDPAARFQSAAELRQALIEVLHRPSRTPARRRAARVIASTVTLSVSILLGAAVAQPAARAELAHALGSVSALTRAAGARLSVLSIGSRGKPPASVAPAEQPKIIAAIVPDQPPAPEADADPDQMQPVPAAPPTLGEEESDLAGELAVDQKSADTREPTPSVVTDAPADDRPAAIIAEARRLTGTNGRLKALHLLRKAGEEYPRDGRVLEAWIAAAEELKGWGEARKVARRWAEVDPSVTSRLALARLERATGNRARAITILRALATESPNSNEIRELLALYSGGERLALNQ